MANPLQLIRFASVADHLSFSEASKSLRIDQATLSRQVRQLEHELGFSLFRRTTRKVELTPQGEAILPAARELARSLAATQREIERVASDNNARLRFGMHPFVYWSPQVLAFLDAFTGRQRDASVETVSGMSARHLARLRTGALDAALVLKEAAPPAFQTLPVMQVEPHIVLPEEQPAAALSALEPADFAGLKIAIFRPGREREDFETVYGWFFRGGAKQIVVSEGAAAVVFHATTDRLAMISLRDMTTPAPAGFVRKRVTGSRPVEFVLARLPREDRATLNHFWSGARRIARPADQ
jgi:DNA-binding transcriptional LysR family regulator